MDKNNLNEMYYQQHMIWHNYMTTKKSIYQL